MKVRVGYGLGTRNTTVDRDRFTELVDALEHHRFDSLWLSERIGGLCPDPVVGMSFTVARTERLKVGMSVMVLPGRNPVVLAKTLASLDRLSAGRLLPAFGLGLADSAEHQAFGVGRRDRGPWFNEALPLLRRLWTEDEVVHHGQRFRIDGVTVVPKPIQDPLEVWLGGSAPAELRRVGRLSDGWLPSFVTPAQAAAGRLVVEEAAAAHDRVIDPGHFGALVPYRPDDRPLPEPVLHLLARRSPGNRPDEVIPVKSQLDRALSRFVDVGFSKFVVVPTVEPASWSAELAELADVVKPIET